LFGKDPIEKEYLDFINEHGKSYGTREEYELRLNIFRKNLKLIQEHNSNNHDDHTLAINHMADWTEAEIQRINGLRRKQRNAKAIQNEKINLEDLPASVNWVEAGAVTPIKDQGALCASDWAFSATGAIEGAYQIKNGELVSFSEQ
jgi:C1A family cysteine protease